MSPGQSSRFACYALVVVIDGGPGADVARVTVALTVLGSMGFIAVASSMLGERLRLRE